MVRLRTELPCDPVTLPLALHKKERHQSEEEETGDAVSRALAWEIQILRFHPHYGIQQGMGHTSVIPALKGVEGGGSEFP